MTSESKELAKEDKLLDRKEVDPAETWDLSTIYPDDAAWEKDFGWLEENLEQLVAYRGRLHEATVLLNFLTAQMALYEKLLRVYVYAHLKHDEDTADTHYQGYFMRIGQLHASVEGALAFARPEIVQIADGQLETMGKEEAGLSEFAHYLEEMRRHKPHLLSDAEETLLAGASQIFDGGAQVFGTLSNADLRFPQVEDETGKKIELTHGRYGRLLESRQRAVRKGAFDAMYKTFGAYRNTFATTLTLKLKSGNYLKSVRKFATAREAALFQNAIPLSVYDNLLATINGRINLLHRYVTMRKKRLGLDQLFPYDLYPPLVEDVDLTYTFEEAERIIKEALKPLGEEYGQILDRAFRERWIDRAENRGKRSGAYSSGTYGINPFILINWQGRLSDLLTLAHELGHSLHTWYSNQNQPIQYADYSIFLAEIASTTNEILLTDYLEKTLTDEQARLYVANHFVDGFKATVFRQAQFAEFEQTIYEADDRGEAVTADYLTEKYASLNQHYYGPDLALDERIGLEWSRIPHFYYDFYVYQYATGFSAASAFAKRILDGEEGVVERYLGVLKAGSSRYPIELLQEAGLDMTTAKPIEAALDVFERYLEKMEIADV